MERWQVSCLVFGLLALLLFIVAPDVLFVVFAGVLLAVFLQGGGAWIAHRTGLPDGVGIGLFLLILVLFFIAVGLFAAPGIADQFEDLLSQLPAGIDAIRARIEQYSWGPQFLDRLNPSGLFSRGRDAASTAVTTTFGALGNFVIILFIGLYVALDPDLYRRGMLKLLAPSIRPRADAVLGQSARTLKKWLVAQLFAMTVVGVLTGLGLFIIGIPLALILGLIAGLLAFIPNIGPVLALVPALLLALPEGTTTLAWVLAVYLGVQTLESYIITPLIQQESVSLPPALVIAVQLLFGVTFGLLGLALATPMAALGMTLTRELYVRDYLEKPQKGLEIDPTRSDR